MSDWSKKLSTIGTIFNCCGIIASVIIGAVVAYEDDSLIPFFLIGGGGILITIASAALFMTIAEIGNNVAAIRKNLENQFCQEKPVDNITDNHTFGN